MFLVWCIFLLLLLAARPIGVGRVPAALDPPHSVPDVGIAVDGVLGVVRGIVMLPARLLRGSRAF